MNEQEEPETRISPSDLVRQLQMRYPRVSVTQRFGAATDLEIAVDLGDAGQSNEAFGKTADEVIAFLSGLGLEVDSTSVSAESKRHREGFVLRRGDLRVSAWYPSEGVL